MAGEGNNDGSVNLKILFVVIWYMCYYNLVVFSIKVY